MMLDIFLGLLSIYVILLISSTIYYGYIFYKAIKEIAEH